MLLSAPGLTAWDVAAVADHLDRGVLPDLELTHGDDELVGVGDRAVTDLHHDVVFQDPGPLRRAPALTLAT